MTAYLAVASFRVRTVMPGEDVDALEVAYPGFLDAKLVEWSSWLNGRLGKRYGVPFTAPVPEIVLSWLTRLVTLDAYLRRGFDPSSKQDAEIVKAAENARAEVKEAADSKDGLWDLPLREDAPGQSGIARGGPLGYSEASPYTWTDRQSEAVRDGG